MKPTIVKTPCMKCKHQKIAACFNYLALQKTACSMEMELYNHGVEKVIGEIILPCRNYISM